MRTTRAYLGAVLLGASVLLTASTPWAGASAGESPDSAPWVGAIRAMDDALARGDLRAALRAREDARLAALSSQRWEGMVMVGDATLRLGRSAGLLPAMEPAARRAYTFALHRANRLGSLDGTIRITLAFAGVGDRDMVRKGFAIAESLAGTSRDPHAIERVRSLEQWIEVEMPPTGGVPPAAAAPMGSAPLAPNDTSRRSQGSE